MKIFTAILVCCFSYNSVAQTECSVNFYISENYGYILPPKTGFFIYSLTNSKNYIKVTLWDCKGKMDIEIYRNDSTLECKGSYLNSLDTLKQYILIDNGHSMKIEVDKYFKPLKDGEWYYYNKKGKIIKKEVYREGILIENKRSD